jgi:alpha-L-arabinofuranosidase
MKKITLPQVAIFVVASLLLLASSSGYSQTRSSGAKITAAIQADQTGVPVHRYAYGMFTELLGNMFEKGIWSEMLSDRKFFYPVNSSETLVPRNSRGRFNRWRPVGADQFVIMDKFNPYVGEQAARVKLDPVQAHGIQQSGFGVGKDRKYTGYIILAGDPGAMVSITLSWGINPGDKETVALPTLSREYKKYPFSFTAGTTSENAGRLEITGTGNGDFLIGAVSLMPADNVDGFRADLVKLLRDMNSAIYRWPGGNFLAGYDWRDGIGDRDKRATRYDYAWNCIEPNDVGTDEYIKLCRLLNLDPYLVVNIGFGDARAAGEWVEYCNGSKDTRMGRLRASNGYTEPFNVRIWGIGNEMYGQWQLGHMSIEHYVIKHRMVADSMRKADPTIKLVACGATLYEINTTNRHHRLLPKERIPYKYGSPEDWDGQLFANDLDYMDFIAEHAYPNFGNAFDTVRQQFVAVRDSLPERVRKTPNRIKGAAEAMYEYQKRYPGVKEKNITYFIDEWSSGARGFEGTLCVALTMHEIFRYTDIYTMSGYTGFTGNVSFNSNEAVYSSTGLFFKTYREHFGTLPLKVTGNSPQKELQGTVLVDKPEKPSGSETYPLDIMAALSSDRKKLTISIVNPTFTDQEADITVRGVSMKKTGTAYQLKSPSIRASNVAGRPPVISVATSRLTAIPVTFSVPPLSVTLYEIDLN